MNESDLKKGVISKGKLRRKIRKSSRPLLGGFAPYDWTKTIPIPPVKIKNQFQSSSCGGQATSYWAEVVDWKLSNQDIPFSAKSIYAPIAYPQGGTTVYALENQFGKKGVNFESDVPSYKADGTTDEPFITDKSYQTPVIANKALRDAYRVPMTVPIDIDSMATAIQESGAIIIEIAGQNNGTWLSAYPKRPVAPFSNQNLNSGTYWAHFMCCVGVSVVNGIKQIDALQSWGDVGDKGIQHFTEDYINSGYIVDCFTWYPLGVNKSSWLWSFYQKFLHIFLS